MKIVSAFHHIKPYTNWHIGLVGRFEWIEALCMLRVSAAVSAGVETFAITDEFLPVPHYRYKTTEALLMLWILEVSLKYLESENFDQDTVYVAPDCLVCAPLDVFDGFDIGVVERPNKFKDQVTLLNGVQFWPYASKNKLIRFYRQALHIAQGLPINVKHWGADTAPIVELLGPINSGVYERNGMLVKIFETDMFISMKRKLLLSQERLVPASRIVDFKADRKAYMVEYFQRVFG